MGQSHLLSVLSEYVFEKSLLQDLYRSLRGPITSRMIGWKKDLVDAVRLTKHLEFTEGELWSTVADYGVGRPYDAKK